ncbi:MAG: endonuclease/exonuclease/phosphatase family protein [Bacteroidales bacterium]|nr:endonuclease/exonuclease/phosphatase family protein [Bacteroidales bacterium]
MSSSSLFFKRALLALTLPLLWGCPGNPDTPDGPQQQDKADLLVCTFNIRYPEPSDGDYVWDKRKDAVCKFILTRKPDIIGMQEVEKVQAAYILSQVKDEYGLYGIGRESGKSILDATTDETSVTILYKKSRFDLSDKGVFWHSDTPDQVVAKNKANDYGSWHTTHPLNSVWVKLADKEKLGRPVWLFTTHYQNNKNCPNASDLRTMESNLHLNLMSQLSGGVIGPACKEALFFLGDFNARPDSPELDRLVNYPMGYARLDAAKSSFRTTDTDNGYGKGGGIIDHIFFCGPLKCLSYSVDKRDYGITYISDHYPVLSEFSYTE